MYSDTMEPLTIRIQESEKESLEEAAAEYDVSVSEYVRTLIDRGREYEDLADRLERREARIEQLEEQLARRSQIEEKVDTLAKRVDETDQVANAPFPVRWWQWWRSRAEG